MISLEPCSSRQNAAGCAVWHRMVTATSVLLLLPPALMVLFLVALVCMLWRKHSK